MNVGVADERRRDIYINHELDDLGLDPYEFRVYARLARRAGTPKGAYESVSEMAKGCRMSERSVHQALRNLEAQGLVRKTTRPGQTSIYHLTDKSEWRTPAPHAEGGLHHTQTTSAPHADKGVQGKGSKGKEVPPSPPTTGQPIQATGESKEEVNFDPKALMRLKRDAPDLVPILENASRANGWKFKHKAWAAAHLLTDASRATDALKASMEGADGAGAAAFRYFQRAYADPRPDKAEKAPSAPEDRSLYRLIGREIVHPEDGRVTITSVSSDGRQLVVDSGEHVTPAEAQSWAA